MTELQRKLLLENLILEKIREIKNIVKNSNIKLNTEYVLNINLNAPLILEKIREV